MQSIKRHIELACLPDKGRCAKCFMRFLVASVWTMSSTSKICPATCTKSTLDVSDSKKYNISLALQSQGAVFGSRSSVSASVFLRGAEHLLTSQSTLTGWCWLPPMSKLGIVSRDLRAETVLHAPVLSTNAVAHESLLPPACSTHRYASKCTLHI